MVEGHPRRIRINKLRMLKSVRHRAGANMKINEARAFIETRVLEPALQSPAVSDTVKSTIRNSLKWPREFRRVGDLILYMDRFRGGADTEVYRGLKAAGLLTFEDIRDEFLDLFGPWA